MQDHEEPIDWKIVELLCMLSILSDLQQTSVTEDLKQLTFKNVLG